MRFKQTDAAGNTMTYGYNDQDRRISTANADGETSTTLLDDAGNVLTSINLLGGPGMQETVSPTSNIAGMGLGEYFVFWREFVASRPHFIVDQRVT
jgi:YD repeat-containing protein